MSTLLNKFYLVKLSIIGEGRRDINKVQNFVHVGFEGVSKRLSVRITSVFFLRNAFIEKKSKKV